MGTRGYRVYRHRGHFYVYYNHSDSYPEGLGLGMWQEVPQCADEVEFERWQEERRARWDQLLKEKAEADGDDTDDYPTEQPINDISIQWIYEIDLDNAVFHVQSLPVFNLRQMPRTADQFIEYLSQDLYRHESYDPNTPLRHRWDSDLRIPIPTPDVALLERYDGLNAAMVDEMLNVPTTPTTELRSVFTQMLVAWSMQRDEAIRAVFQAKTMRVTGIASVITNFSILVMRLLLQPPTIPPRLKDAPKNVPLTSIWKKWFASPKEGSADERSWWLRENTCIHFRAHLTDQDTLKAAVSEAIRFMDQSPLDEELYAILHSVSHCAIVKYHRKEHSVHHTSAMELLPSFHVKWSCTHGIRAIIDLCYHLDNLSNGHPYINPPPTKDSGPLPVEVLGRIAFFIRDSHTLLKFASASTCCKAAAKPMLLLPMVEEDIIVSFSLPSPDAPDEGFKRDAKEMTFSCANGKEGVQLEQWFPVKADSRFTNYMINMQSRSMSTFDGMYEHLAQF